MGALAILRACAINPPEFQTLNVISTAGATILGLGYVIPLVYFAWSVRYGAPAGDNPWKATGLEWTTSSPPITHNFEETPVATEEPYVYDRIAEEIQVA